MSAENMSFNPVAKTCLIARLCLCVSVLALSGCSTVNTDRYAFWHSSNNNDNAPDLRDMPNNTHGDNQARNKLSGLQQELMADHAAAIAALQSQGAPTVSVLSSAQDIVPVTQNKVSQQPLMPPPLPVKLPQPKIAAAPMPVTQPPQPTPVAAGAPAKPAVRWSGVSVLPQSINSVPAPAKAVVVAPTPVLQAAPAVAFTTPTKPQVPAALPAPVTPPQAEVANAHNLVVAEQPLPPPTMPAAPIALPTTPTLATPARSTPEYQPKPLRTYVMPSSAGAPQQNSPSIVADDTLTAQPVMVAPAPIAQAIANNSSIDINMDALDSFAAPTPLVPPQAKPQRITPPIRPEVADAQQPYAYGYSNYSIKREMFENNQGNPIPTNDSVLINPIWEAAPMPGSFGQPIHSNVNSNPQSSFDAPIMGDLLASVPFANNAAKLGPQGLKAVGIIAAQWQRDPQNLVLSSFASGRSATANQALANARSNAVKQQLVTLGVPARQIRLVAYSNNQNKTPHVDVFADSE